MLRSSRAWDPDNATVTPDSLGGCERRETADLRRASATLFLEFIVIKLCWYSFSLSVHEAGNPMSRASYRGGAPDVTPAFANRDYQREVFRTALQQRQGPDDYRVLVFFGPGGHGKTWLSEDFTRTLNKKEVAYATLNFDRKTDDGLHHRNPVLAIKALRCQLSDSLGGAAFPAFDVAFRHYHERGRTGQSFDKAHPELGSKNLFLRTALVSGDVVTGGGVSLIYEELRRRFGAKVQQWYAKHAAELLNDLSALSLEKLRERLAVCFAADLAHHAWGGNSDPSCDPARRIVILIDTYEALFEELTAKRGLGTDRVDDWVRKLVDETPGVLWVITGRDRLSWDSGSDFDAEHYAAALQQVPLDGLPAHDARQALIDAGVEEEAIRDRMLQGALMRSGNVHPFYLDLQAQLYGRMRADGGLYGPEGELLTDRFGGSEQKVIARFLEYVDPDECRVLRLLAQPRHFDRALFEHLYEKFLVGVSVTYQDLVRRSLFRTSGKSNDLNAAATRTSMHDLLRDYLCQEAFHDEPERSREVHDTLFRWYHDIAQENLLSDLQVAEAALQEAAYHKSLAGDEPFVDWCASQLAQFNHEGLFETTRRLLRDSLAALDGLEPGALGSVDPEGSEQIAMRRSLLRRGLLTQMLAKATETDGEGSEAESHYRAVLEIYGLAAQPWAEAASRILADFGERRSQARSEESESASVFQILEPSLEIYSAARTSDMPEADRFVAYLREILAVESQAAAAQQEPWRFAGDELVSLLEYCQRVNRIRVREAQLGFAQYLTRRGQPEDYDAASSLFDEVISDLRGFANVPKLASVLTRAWAGFGSFLVTRGRALEAEPLLFRAWDYARKNDRPADAANNAKLLADCMLVLGRLPEAEQFAKESAEYWGGRVGSDHHWTAVAIMNIAEAQSRQGVHTEAREGIRRVCESFRTRLGDEHYWVGHAELARSRVELRAGRAPGARSSALEAVRILSNTFGSEHLIVGRAIAALAAALAESGESEKAIERFRESLRIIESSGGFDHPATLLCFDGLIPLLQTEAPEEAERYKIHRKQVARSLRVDLELHFPDTWEPSADEADKIIDRCRQSGSFPADLSHVRVQLARLPFLPSHAVATFEFTATEFPSAKHAILSLEDESDVIVVDWTFAPCHALAERYPLQLDDETALAYSRLFFDSLRSDSGRFRIVERVEDIAWQELMPEEAVQQQREEIADLLRPRSILSVEEQRAYVDDLVAKLNATLQEIAEAKADFGSEETGSKQLELLDRLVDGEAELDDDGNWQVFVAGELLVADGRAKSVRVVEAGRMIALEVVHDESPPRPLPDAGKGLGGLVDLHNATIAGTHTAIESDVAHRNALYRTVTGLDRAGRMTMRWDWEVARDLLMGLRKFAPATKSLEREATAD